MRFFDWFRGRPRQEHPPEEWWVRLSRIEHQQEQLALSWEETYGKVRRALATLAKRQQREGADAAEQPTNGGGAPSSRESPYQEAVRRGLFGGM
jgi:hypothetical protein